LSTHPKKIEQALATFSQESTLVALRELALRQTAYEVETRQSEMSTNRVADQGTKTDEASITSASGRQEKILIHITSDPNTAVLVRRGKRVADYLHTDCFAVAVHSGADFNAMPTREREPIERHLNFARSLHIETRVLQGDLARTLVDCPHEWHHPGVRKSAFPDLLASAGWIRPRGGHCPARQ
jgi:two-component system sensor histidine kinase KdpD